MQRVDPPLWVIGTIAQEFKGFRLPKRTVLDFKDKCGVCLLAISGHTYIVDGKKMCYECETAHFRRKRESMRSINESVSILRSLGPAQYPFPEGNLTSSEYRYLIGFSNQHARSGLCRVCHKVFYGTLEERTSLWSGHNAVRAELTGFTCPVRLQRAYKICQQEKRCVTCGSKATQEKWGAPFCKDEDCMMMFKFDQRDLPYLSQKLRLVEEDLRAKRLSL